MNSKFKIGFYNPFVIELEAKEIREFKEYKEISELLIIFPNLPKFPKREQSVQARSTLSLIVIFLIAPTRAKMRNDVYIFSFNSTKSQEKSRFCDFFLNFKVLFQILCRIGLYLVSEKHIV